MSLFEDPANTVVARAAMLREQYPTLTHDQARYIAHCIVRHHADLGVLNVDAASTFAEWHSKMHVDDGRPGYHVDHIHGTYAWPE